MSDDRIRVFFLKPTNLHRRSLRRSQKDGASVAGQGHYCLASNEIDTIDHPEPVSGMIEWPRDDGSWPLVCAECGKRFQPDDYWLVDHDRIYLRADNGQEVTLRTAPPGACWDADWFRDHPQYRGPDGRTLVIRLPDGRDGMIDSRAGNCTMPADTEHKCWVRHGRPEDGTLHVDKNGKTCAAGAGSIDTGTWHGFLHNGYLRRC